MATLLRLPKASVAGYVLETPDPHVAQVRISETDKDYLIALNELDMAKALLQERPADQVFDRGAIAVKAELGQAPLVPTILADVLALPYQARLQLHPDTSLEVALQNARSLIQPILSTPADLLEQLVAKYEQGTRDCQTACVFLSAGWDSRLEICLVRAAMGEAGTIYALHIYTSDPELDIARRVAEEVGATLLVYDAAGLLQVGLQWYRLINRLGLESTWRPTVPIYGTIIAAAVHRLGTCCVFGFTSYPLKGRHYDEPVTSHPPCSGRVRVLGSSKAQELLADQRQKQVAINSQGFLWKALANMSKGWPDAPRRDYINWTAQYGYAYSHRTRSLSFLGQQSPFAESDILSAFMGLEAQDKVGITFIRGALNALNAKVSEIPVLASSGDVSQKITTPAGILQSAEPTINKLSPLGGYPVGLSAIHTASLTTETDIYAAAFSGRSILLRAELVKASLAREVLDFGISMGGPYLVNSVQLAEFLKRCQD
ncbi:hypothetical protein [Lamprocystis purpurea]|jgi:hypothetical protein|uniref:hypothetical protein n=1 Tax=Lamprocystis purpurea TaxID=61598 RepID=UPI000364A625|nr:hypothetical protein [Lamprocystis purpurea]